MSAHSVLICSEGHTFILQPSLQALSETGSHHFHIHSCVNSCWYICKQKAAGEKLECPEDSFCVFMLKLSIYLLYSVVFVLFCSLLVAIDGLYLGDFLYQLFSNMLVFFLISFPSSPYFLSQLSCSHPITSCVDLVLFSLDVGFSTCLTACIYSQCST